MIDRDYVKRAEDWAEWRRYLQDVDALLAENTPVWQPSAVGEPLPSGSGAIVVLMRSEFDA